MWGASRGDRDTEILELDPNSGTELNAIPAPAVVNGAATGLAINATRSSTGNTPLLTLWSSS